MDRRLSEAHCRSRCCAGQPPASARNLTGACLFSAFSMAAVLSQLFRFSTFDKFVGWRLLQGLNNTFIKFKVTTFLQTCTVSPLRPVPNYKSRKKCSLREKRCFYLQRVYHLEIAVFYSNESASHRNALQLISTRIRYAPRLLLIGWSTILTENETSENIYMNIFSPLLMELCQKNCNESKINYRSVTSSAVGIRVMNDWLARILYEFD